MITLAEQVGQTPHMSPLLRRLRRVGLSSPEDLRRLAVARGCAHYRQAGDDLDIQSRRPEWQCISNLELAMAMLTAEQEFVPVLIRCAAQLLSDAEIRAEDIARLALQERAVPMVRHIAQAGVALDPLGRGKWQRLLDLLPARRPVPHGRLPHRSRFVSATGLSWQNGRLDRGGRVDWLRPARRTPS